MRGKVYLAHTAADCSVVRSDLSAVLKNAGLDVLPQSNFDHFEESSAMLELGEADCSVHILGGKVGEKTSLGIPHTVYQIQEAIKQIGKKKGFKVFIWNVSPSQGMVLEDEQNTIINHIRNNIVDHVVFTNLPSTVQLVDDIRSMLESRTETEEITVQFPVSVLYNFIDEDDANEVTEMLSDIIEVKTMIVGEEQDVDYGVASLRIIKSSELGVVFFSEASSWAIPFVQQIWKMSGGAACKTPLLFIGNEGNDENLAVAFNAPNVINKKVTLDLIPLEIKVTYDKLKG